MNANNSYCSPAESLWMKSGTVVLKACVVSVVWLQSHAFQEVSSQEIFLFKPSAIHEPHFWNEPTKLCQPHSFNKTPTTVCPGSKQQPAQFHWFSAWCYYTTGISNTNNRENSLLYPFHTNTYEFLLLIFSLLPDLWITAHISALFGNLEKAWCCSRELQFPGYKGWAKQYLSVRPKLVTSSLQSWDRS